MAIAVIYFGGAIFRSPRRQRGIIGMEVLLMGPMTEAMEPSVTFEGYLNGAKWICLNALPCDGEGIFRQLYIRQQGSH